MNKRTLIRIIRLTVSLVLLAIIYQRVDLLELSLLLISARWELLLLSLALIYTNISLSAFKWRLFLAADGIDVPYLNLLNSYLIGSFMSLFLPSNIGGDAYRVVDIARRSKRTAGTLASVLADRLTGLAALSVLGTAFGLLSLRYVSETWIFLLPLIAMMLLAGLMVALFQERLLRCIFSWGPLRRMPKVSGGAEKLIASVAQYRCTRKLLRRTLAVSFLFQFNVIVCIFVLSSALGLSIPFLYICTFIPIISVIEAIPISIFGLGIRDASYVFFFSAVGIPQVDSLALAVAYVIITLVSSLFGAMLLLWRTVKTPVIESVKPPSSSTSRH